MQQPAGQIYNTPLPVRVCCQTAAAGQPQLLVQGSMMQL